MRDTPKLEDTRSTIIIKATELFKRKGFAGVTVKDICEAAGITRGAYYYYFDSKEGILDTYFSDIDSLPPAALAEAFETDSYIGRFFYLFELYLSRNLEGGPEIMSLMLRRMLEKNSESFNPDSIVQRSMYVSLISKAQAAGEIANPAPPETLVDAIVYIADGISFVWSNQKERMDMMAEHRRMIGALLQVQL